MMVNSKSTFHGLYMATPASVSTMHTLSVRMSTQCDAKFIVFACVC